MNSQNYKNHYKVVPGYHFITLGISVITLIGAFINTYKSYVTGNGLYSASLILTMAVLLMLVAAYTRAFALKAQDRAIRAEENFRYYLMTGKPLPRELNIRQIIALRFASDEEFIELTERAIKESLSEKQIKKAIKNWKGDHYRV